MSLVAEYQSGSESDSGSNKGADDVADTAAEKVDKEANGCDNKNEAVRESNGASEGSENGINRKESTVNVKLPSTSSALKNEAVREANGAYEGSENGVNRKQSPVKLPSASSVLKKPVTAKNSVLATEYINEEENRTKVLEQHVKMVNNAKSVPVNGKVNGKVVCWMYRRGRCRLGKKCKMYHDSELRTTEVKQKSSTEPNQHVETPVHTPSLQKRSYDETVTEECDDTDGPKSKIQKKRFGLSDDLVPSKKVVQHLERISKESQPGH